MLITNTRPSFPSPTSANLFLLSKNQEIPEPVESHGNFHLAAISCLQTWNAGLMFGWLFKVFVGAHKRRLLCWLHVIAGPSPTLLGVLLLRSDLFCHFYWMFDLAHWSSLWPAVVHFTKAVFLCKLRPWIQSVVNFLHQKASSAVAEHLPLEWKKCSHVGWIWDVKIATLLPLLLFILRFGSAWCNAALVFTGMEWTAWFSLKILPMWTLSACWASTATSTAHSTMTSKVTRQTVTHTWTDKLVVSTADKKLRKNTSQNQNFPSALVFF